MSDDELALLQEQLSEARGEVERLQLAAADSEARALHLEEMARDVRGRLEAVEAELASERERAGELTGQIEGLQTELAGRQEETQELHARLLAAAGKHREVLLAAAPELPAELVAGETIEELDAAAERARQTVRQVRERLESEARAGRMPTGSPPRGSPDFSTLSSIEKIRLGLNRAP
jgi:chromosome segregation ATPase